MEKILRRATAALALSVFAAGIMVAGISHAQSNDAIMKLEAAKGNYLASVRAEAIRTGNSAPGDLATGPASSWLTRVKSNEVNMVTNRFAGKAQDSIELAGKTYWGTGEGCSLNMARNDSTRFSKDPFTNRSVDKADAVIFADALGAVLYFESEDSFKSFVGLASPETIYGYSEPK